MVSGCGFGCERFVFRVYDLGIGAEGLFVQPRTDSIQYIRLWGLGRQDFRISAVGKNREFRGRGRALVAFLSLRLL